MSSLRRRASSRPSALAAALVVTVSLAGACSSGGGGDGASGSATSVTAPGATAGGPTTSAGATAVTGAAGATTTPGAGTTVASAATTQATAPAPVLGRPIDDGTGLRLGYVPAEYGLAGVQGWPADAQEGTPRSRSLFLNGPEGQVDVVVARDTPFEVPAGASSVTVQGRPGYTTTTPQATVSFTPAEGVVLTVTSTGLSLEELTLVAEGLRYEPGKDNLPEP